MVTMIDRLKKVGFWKPIAPSSHGTDTLHLSLISAVAAMLGALSEDDLPDPNDLIDPTWRRREREKVLEYVTRPAFHGQSYCGYSSCRCCGKHDNGTADFSDGVYMWPEGFGHYIDAHNVKPPQHFIGHVLRSR